MKASVKDGKKETIFSSTIEFPNYAAHINDPIMTSTPVSFLCHLMDVLSVAYRCKAGRLALGIRRSRDL